MSDHLLTSNKVTHTSEHRIAPSGIRARLVFREGKFDLHPRVLKRQETASRLFRYAPGAIPIHRTNIPINAH
jgi:hypothetical protein